MKTLLLCLFSIIFNICKYILVAIFSPFYIGHHVYSIFKRRDIPLDKVDVANEPSCLRDATLGRHGSVHLKGRGVEIHYVAKGDVSKPLMLFLHGFPEFWYSWRFQLREFGKDFYAVAMDMTGYGGSSQPSDVERYGRKELATDIKELVLALGFESCILVGHDWGGCLCYEVSYYYPEVVRHMIVLDAPYLTASFYNITLKQLVMSSYIGYFQLPIVPEYFFSRDQCAALEFMRKGFISCKSKVNFTKEDLNAYRYTFMKSGFTGGLNYYRQLVKPESFLEGEGRQLVKVPSLIIWGTDDKILGTQLATSSAKYMKECAVKYVDDASHWIQIERPDDVNKLMRDYLEEIEK